MRSIAYLLYLAITRCYEGSVYRQTRLGELDSDSGFAGAICRVRFFPIQKRGAYDKSLRTANLGVSAISNRIAETSTVKYLQYYQVIVYVRLSQQILFCKQ